MAMLFLILILALFVGAAVLYAMNLHWWRVSLIGGVLFGAVALLWVPGVYEPADRLKPGIDLAGGTRLVYDVVVPQGQPKGQVIEETIEILADRVDPAGTRGLVWREVAGQRIEVSMASAPEKVRQARERYNEAVAALKEGNLTAAALDDAMESDSTEKLEDLADGDQALLEDLQDLKDLYDQREAKRSLYFQAAEAWNAVKDDVPEEEWDDHPAYQKLLLEEEFYFDVADRFKAKQTDILEANSFNPAEFEFLEAIPPQTLSEAQRAAGETTPREDRLAQLKEDYPSRAKQLQKAYDALLAYEEVKGPLDGPEDLIALLQGSGVMEFRIAADPTATDLQPYKTQLDQQGPRVRPDAKYRWFEVDDLEQYVDDPAQRSEVEDLLAMSLSVDPSEQAEARQQIEAFFESREVVARPYAGRLYLLLHNDEGFAMTRDDDWAVSNVNRGMDELNRPTVNYSLDAKGASMMRSMTRPNVGRPMAVLIDNNVLTTPNINQALSTNVQISGEFSEREINYLRDTMRAGALEGQLSELPVSQLTIGATLGQDNVQAGLQAAVTALVLVAIFIAIYYFFAGMVANFALAANMVLILGILAMTQATFTLPGIAGLVLTIGMAVDANVLIFERIREELMDRKVNVEIAVRQGYGKALSTILDANITTLITCLILGYTATSDVKGFAVVLGIGILATLFTALFCTKVLIDLYVRYRKPRTLEMLPTMFPAMHKLLHPNVNWISKAKFIVPFSIVIIGLGLTEAFAVRGVDMLDIEFRSGTAVGFELKPTGETDEDGDPELTTMEIGEARERIAEVAEIATEIQAAREAGETYTPETDQEREVLAAVDLAYDRHEQSRAEYERMSASGRSRSPMTCPSSRCSRMRRSSRPARATTPSAPAASTSRR